jgi:hypothetical protein
VISEHARAAGKEDIAEHRERQCEQTGKRNKSRAPVFHDDKIDNARGQQSENQRKR